MRMNKSEYFNLFNSASYDSVNACFISNPTLYS